MPHDSYQRYAIVPLQAGPAPSEAIVVGGLDDVLSYLPQTVVRERRERQLADDEARLTRRADSVRLRAEQVIEREHEIKQREDTCRAIQADAIRRFRDGVLELKHRLDRFEQQRIAGAIAALPDRDDPEGRSKAEQRAEADNLPPAPLPPPLGDEREVETVLERKRAGLIKVPAALRDLAATTGRSQMQRVLMLSISGAVMTWAASAVADSPKLKGDYGFTRNEQCIVSSSPFTDDHQAMVPNNARQGFVSEGVRTFNGDGTGTVSFKSLNIIVPGSLQGADTSETTDQKFTYVVNGAGTWSTPGGGSSHGTVHTGPRAGQTFTISHIAPAVGHISKNAQTLTLSTVTPPTTANSEIIDYFDPTTSPPTPKGTLYRICNRSSVLISLGKDD
jgi:hypothetical protein